MKLTTIKDIDVSKKRVLLRVDYNMPVKDGEVEDILRIESTRETIDYLLEHGCSLVLMSHMGRPDGKPVPEFSLEPIAKKASEVLGRDIRFVPETIGAAATAAVEALQPGEVILLENLRFHPEEEANDPDFAQNLAEYGEVYVDDAFAAIHRAHASTVGVASLLPAAAGLLVEKEVAHITGALEHPAKPLVAIVGGAKVSSKIEVLDNLIKYVDKLVIGGAMANTFLASQGHQVGKSKQEPDLFAEAGRIIADCGERGVELILPDDVMVAKSVSEGPAHQVDIGGVVEDDYIIDLGPKTVAKIINPIDFHGTVIWNGPLGITEVEEFAHNSRLLADNIIDSGATSIIGGGDTAAFVDEAGLHDRFTWVSTGGGASLELMAGRELPGLTVLQAK